MIEINFDENAGADFKLAALALSNADVRPEVKIVQIEAPQNLARHALAFSCDVDPESTSAKIDLGTGRFVLLWDDLPQENWSSNFRVICFAKSPLETDIGFNDESSDLAWAWIVTALGNRGASYAAEAGTTTRVISVGHGSIAAQNPHAELELRASWCPEGDNFAAHIEAWQDLICMMSGYSLHGEDVPTIERRR
ncbi:MAG: hypothetical protein RL488_1065 [Actinomycetota bacterium]|jgi:hypothetical protein